MIQLTDIHKWFFKGTDREVHALRGINMVLDPGSFTIVIGANGSGKSTLLNLIAGNIISDTGTIEMNGVDVTKLKDHERSHHVSRVFQDPFVGTASELTVLENFRLASLRSRKKSLSTGLNSSFKATVMDLVRPLELGLEHKLNQPIGTLSGGQRQALTLLMTTMDHSDILLLDEPTSALDPNTSNLIMKLANTISKDRMLTTVLVTHNLKDAEMYGDRILMMENGAIAKDVSGSQKDNLKSADLFSWFQ
jgi:putative tryptophan/tyrosine transport system ATP-binding protein